MNKINDSSSKLGEDRVKNSKMKLGRQGEDIAAQYLQGQGYRLLQRNFRSRCGEIDIICADKQTIIFVEVKTRTSSKFGSPEESITRTKQQHIYKAAFTFMEGYPHHFKDIRFDAIGIYIEDGKPRINHIMGAF